jgi:hypothetical protein
MQTFHTYEKIDGQIVHTGIARHWEHYSVWLAWCGVKAETAYARNEVAHDMPTKSITWFAPNGVCNDERFGISLDVDTNTATMP